MTTGSSLYLVFYLDFFLTFRLSQNLGKTWGHFFRKEIRNGSTLEIFIPKLWHKELRKNHSRYFKKLLKLIYIFFNFGPPWAAEGRSCAYIFMPRNM